MFQFKVWFLEFELFEFGVEVFGGLNDFEFCVGLTGGFSSKSGKNGFESRDD